MIRAWYKAVAAAVAMIAAVATPPAARATLEVDPAVLYAQMKDAYAKAEAAGWDFRSQEIYLSTIFNAGRAYSLQYPGDPAYGELATLTVRIGTGLHYNPLTNHDGAVWWVREASDWTMKHSDDAATIVQAQGLMQRVNSEEDPAGLARLADADALANLKNYPGDVDAQLMVSRGRLARGCSPATRSGVRLRFRGPLRPAFRLRTCRRVGATSL